MPAFGPPILDGGDAINAGLLRFLPLAEDAGAVLFDVSPLQRDGLYTGGVARVIAPKLGKVANFPSSGRYGLVNSGKTVSGLSHWSIAVWARIPSGYSSFAGSCFYSERAASGNDIVKLDGLSSGLGLSNVPFITMRDDAGTLIQGCAASTAVNDGEWHFIVATKAAGTLSIYVDGKRENTAAWAGSDTFTDAGIESRIASDQAAPGDSAYGDYGLVRLYARALTPSDVSRLYADPWAGTAQRRKVVFPAAAPPPATTWLGVFDPEIIAQAWFDPVIRPIGWWDRDLVDAPAAGGDVTVAVTGVAATGAVGSVAPSLSVPLSGVAGTGEVGSVVPSLAVPITGVAGTGSVGTVGPGTAVVASGVAASGEVGTVAPSLAVALTGIEGIATAGDVGISGDVTVALSGVSATGETGSLAAATEAADTPSVGGDDAPAQREDVAKLSRRQRRLEREADERAARLRATLERAYRAATGGDDGATEAALAEAAEIAPPAVAEQIAAIPMGDGISQLLAGIADAIAAIQRKKYVVSRDDDDFAAIISVF